MIFGTDCIGSAFNMKGMMQCPNCREIEKGRWLYASGSTNSSPEPGMDDGSVDSYPFYFTFSEMVTPDDTSFLHFSCLLASMYSVISYLINLYLQEKKKQKKREMKDQNLEIQ